MLRRARVLITAFGGSLPSALALGLITEFFVEWVRRKGWYDDPIQMLDTAVSWLASFVTQRWFLIATGFSVGLAIGMWLDTYLGYREQLSEIDQYHHEIDRLSAFNSHKRRALTRRLRRLNTGEHNVHVHISKAVDLPMADAVASCFKRAGWETHIHEKPRTERIGERNPGVLNHIAGFNSELVKLVASALPQVGIPVDQHGGHKSNKTARDGPFWQRVDRRIHLWIGPCP